MSQLFDYKCPACGGALEFNSAAQNMKCPYCDHEVSVEALAKQDEQLDRQPADAAVGSDWTVGSGASWSAAESEGMAVYSCQSCGGEVMGDETTAATSCPFCGNPVVMARQFSGELKPDLIIPFKLDRKTAIANLNKHLQGKFLLPAVFKAQHHIDEVKGVYVPFWLYDADVDADVSFEGTKVRRYSDSQFNYKETSYYAIRRKGRLSFEHIPVDGSSKMADTLMEFIEPYHQEDLTDFRTPYLAGYVADRYDVTAEQGAPRANERIEESTMQLFRSDVSGFDTCNVRDKRIQLISGKAQYALYPIWMLNTTWQNRQYTFAMNGQTGKFVGDLPVDRSKYRRWLGLLTAGISVLAFGLLYLLTMR